MAKLTPQYYSSSSSGYPCPHCGQYKISFTSTNPNVYNTNITTHPSSPISGGPIQGAPSEGGEMIRKPNPVRFQGEGDVECDPVSIHARLRRELSAISELMETLEGEKIEKADEAAYFVREAMGSLDSLAK